LVPCLQAKLEPPWLERYPKDLHAWGALIEALSVLALRSAALESLLEARRRLASQNSVLLRGQGMPRPDWLHHSL
jgi:hypothetical protein